MIYDSRETSRGAEALGRRVAAARPPLARLRAVARRQCFGRGGAGLRVRAAVVLAAALVLPLGACGGGGAAGVEDVVVVVLDALPARALACYGNPLPTSPHIDRFAAQCVRFEAAYAPAPSTLPSIASLFTGLRPEAHGLHGRAGNVLADEERTLAEVLRAAGFATHAVSCNANVTAEGGFDQGFDDFVYVRPEHEGGVHSVPAGLVADTAAWWRGASGRRRFLYVHLLPPHQPYAPPPPHDALFGAAETDPIEGCTEYLTQLNEARRELHLRADDPRIRSIRARYLAGVHHADAAFGELLAALGEGGGLARSAVVFVSDHGEAFAEHGRLLHSSTVYEEMTHVPLLVRAPGLAPRSVDEPVSTLDVGRTVCELLGVELRPRADGAGSLLAQLLGEADWRGSPVVSAARSARALRTTRWSLVMHERRGGDHNELYDRESDPGEASDVARQHPAVVEALSAELKALQRGDRAAGEGRGVASTDAHADELRALGYTGDE